VKTYASVCAGMFLVMALHQISGLAGIVRKPSWIGAVSTIWGFVVMVRIVIVCDRDEVWNG